MKSTTASSDKRHGRRVASISLLCVLLLGYAAIYFVDDGDDDRFASSAPRRYLQIEEQLEEQTRPDLPRGRNLARSHQSPPALDEVPGEYIVKPWVGTAYNDVWETLAQTQLLLAGVQASSSAPGNFPVRNVLDDTQTYNEWGYEYANGWRSGHDANGKTSDTEWITIDMGIPQLVDRVTIDWDAGYAQDYQIQVARERKDCRSNGKSCPEAWITAVDVAGKTGDYATTDVFDDADHALQGMRYVRIKMTRKRSGYNFFSVHFVRVYRKKMTVGETPSGASCASTMAAATAGLLGTYGGSLIQSYELAEFFAASMTEAQKEAMMADSCVYAVEPNYVVKARGRTSKRLGKDGGGGGGVNRRLAIPEFNRIDENPANWGLERISSYGAKNGRYKWIHEGKETHIFIFDTGVYPDHSDFEKEYDGSSRLGDGVLCAGSSTDYENADHGTHIASIAGGQTFGTAKETTVHPMQVLDANGEGSTATVLCGIEKLLQDKIDIDAEIAPKKTQAIVNLSLGVDGKSDALDRAVRELAKKGFIVTIAAGNHDDNACFYSPYDPTTITVGALKDHEGGVNDKTSTSNYGECIDVWAPGEDISGASNTGEFDSVLKSGTSVAAAFTAGAATLFFEEINTEEYGPDQFAEKVKEKLINKAEVNMLGDVGYGSVDKMLQTTASRCSQNSHCDVGLQCIVDGVCWDPKKPLREPKKFS